MEISTSLPAIDAEGYLVEPQDWSEALAEEFARRKTSSSPKTIGTRFVSCASFTMNTKSRPMPAL